ncbi:MAG TPA: endonuclease III [Pirellulales bacterium]|nr:endonuclease III [Pirellulales bacterium]
MPDTAERARRARRIARALGRAYPDAQCSLEHRSPLELLVATILSAQCTDERVNIVTRTLFRKYRSADDYANAPIAELENDIRSTGFYRNKAKNIQAACRAIIDQHGGRVPKTLEELVELPGVGRKTANVVLGTAYDIASGVVVDTHVARLSFRLGLTKSSDPVQIERELIAQLPQSEWVAFSHRLIQHGRRICIARKPDCAHCFLLSLCPRHGVKEPVAATVKATRTAKPRMRSDRSTPLSRTKTAKP